MKKFNEMKLRDKIATLIIWILFIFVLGIILSSVYNFFHFYGFNEKKLKSYEDKIAVAEAFQINLSENIDIVSLGYDKDNLYILITDIVDLNEMLEKNLNYKNREDIVMCITDFNSAVERGETYNSEFFNQYYEGDVTKLEQIGESEAKYLFLYYKDNKLYCELKCNMQWENSKIKSLINY